MKRKPNNPRQISKREFERLAADLERFGDLGGVVHNETTGNFVGGNQRSSVFELERQGAQITVTETYAEPTRTGTVARGYVEWRGERYDYRRVRWDTETEDAACLVANLRGGSWDFDALSAWDGDLLQGIGFDGDLLAAWNDQAANLRELLESEKPAPVEDAGAQVDKAEELREKWGVETGQLWQLGEHRIICGDCTDKAVVERVMGGEKANLLFTSPPYWVGMDYETQKSEQEIDEFIHACSRTFTEFISVDNGRIVINTGTAAIHRIEKKRKVEVLPLIFKWQMELRQSGWLARHYRIWAKSGGFAGGVVSPKVDAVDQHWETITTFSAETEEQQYIGTYWCPAGLQRGQEKVGEKWAQQGIWTDIQGDKSAGGTHVAAFPLELPERNIRLYSKDSEIVFEPFLGSGTTLIACERLGRKCRAVEISPAYVAVAIQRWVDVTGGTPELLE